MTNLLWPNALLKIASFWLCHKNYHHQTHEPDQELMPIPNHTITTQQPGLHTRSFFRRTAALAPHRMRTSAHQKPTHFLEIMEILIIIFWGGSSTFFFCVVNCRPLFWCKSVHRQSGAVVHFVRLLTWISKIKKKSKVPAHRRTAPHFSAPCAALTTTHSCTKINIKQSLSFH